MIKNRFFGLVLLALFLVSCSTGDRDHKLLISIPNQKLTLFTKGIPVATYPVSTSKYGVGDTFGSRATPLGRFEIAEKIGGDAPSGAVIKSRRLTGEILRPNALGRDPIVSRIIWLRGLEPCNQNAYDRYIYIHGTVAERDIGKAVSYGCIRMKSADVIELYNTVGVGAEVQITEK